MQAIFTVALPIFGVILAGYLACRFRVLGGDATVALTAFVSTVALSVLFFGALARMSLQGGIAASKGNVAYMGVPLCLGAFGGQACRRPCCWSSSLPSCRWCSAS